MKYIQLTGFLLLFSIITNAQTGAKSDVKRMLFHSHGISFQKFNNLNNRISTYPQFQQPKNSTGTFELGFLTERNRFVSGLSFNVGSSLGGSRNKKSSSTSFVGIAIDAGYNLLKSARFSLYPFAGLGYESYRVTLNRDNSSVPFDSVLQSNVFQQRAESLLFTNSFLVYRVGMGAFVTSKKHTQNSVGLQVGYTGGFKPGDWKINGSQTLLNSPVDNLSKIYTSIIIRYELKRKNRRF